ncbi:MAG: RNA 2',3'-cyclic phosphodiesterase [Planctomycetes bacterium]|nr:RNA 2',3'-cyclic phosphodiesterase [Planctomycetota bacterium]
MRAFAAIEISPECRVWLARGIEELRPRWPDIRWVDPANIHLTLHFFGEIRDEEAVPIAEALRRAAARSAPFALALDRPGSFGRGAPRVFWIGVGEGLEPLRSLHRGVEAELEAIGYRGERRAFQPHATIGRSRKAVRGVDLAGAFPLPSPAWDVEALVLFSSLLRPSGPVYTKVAELTIDSGGCDAGRRDAGR